MSADGDVVVVWASYGQDGSDGGIFGRRYAADGASMGGEFQVHVYTTGRQSYPAVAMAADGRFVVVWQSMGQDGDDFGVFGRTYQANGTPIGGEFQVNAYTTQNQFYPTVAMADDARFVVAWSSEYGQDGQGAGVFARLFHAGGTPIGGELQVNVFTTSHQGIPSADMAPDGRFVIAWRGFGQDSVLSTGAFGRRYQDDGMAVGSEFQINTYTTGNQHFPSAAMAADGRFAAAWFSDDQDGSSTGVFGQRYQADGNPAGGEFQVNTYTTSYQQDMRVGMDGSGNFVVTWMSGGLQDGHTRGVFAQRFNAAGARVGSEFQVNSYTIDFQQFPAVAMRPTGFFVVVWESNTQDGSAYGIFAQRYDQIFADGFEGS